MYIWETGDLKGKSQEEEHWGRVYEGSGRY